MTQCLDNGLIQLELQSIPNCSHVTWLPVNGMLGSIQIASDDLIVMVWPVPSMNTRT
jgi:hypothetical protein